MQKYRDIAIDNTGNAILSATITVTNNSGGGAAVIYSNNAGASLANPFTSSSIDGAYELYAENGRYDITVAKVGYDTETIQDISLFDGDDAIESYDNIADLRSITLIPQTTKAKIPGYTTDGDGGGGDFYWDSTSTETDNGGTIIKATAITTGRWIRLYSGSVNVKWFGAKGDGAADDVLAIQAGIDYSSTLKKALFFPIGTYLIASRLLLKSDTHILGEGRYGAMITLQQSNIVTFDFSMFEATTALTNVSIKSIGLRGNRGFQTTNASNGADDGYAVQLNKASTVNFTVQDCYIHEFGDNASAGGGGVILIPESGVADGSLDNINFYDNHFGASNNVPGIMVQPYVATAGSVEGVRISRNRFEGGGDQNCVYVLGDDTAKAYNVSTTDNEFIMLEDCDFAIEYNGTFGGVITGNTIRSTTTGLCGGILIRGGGSDVLDLETLVISNNTIINENAGDKDGISLVAFSSPGYQDNVIIANNIIVDHGKTGGSFTAIKILKGSRGITVVGNQIIGDASRLEAAFTLGECSAVQIKDNYVKKSDFIALISTGTDPAPRDITIKNNDFDTCGQNAATMISTTGGTIDLEGLLISGNKAFNTVSGTISLADINTSATTGNRLFDNICDVDEATTIADWEPYHQNISGSTTSQTDVATTTYTDTTLTAAITPRDTNSVIRIDIMQSLAILSGGAQDLKFRILRDAVVIYENTRTLGNGTDIQGMASLTIEDSPGTTSATTYKTQIAEDTGGGATVRAQSSGNKSIIRLVEKSGT